jgi:hypothetical protein
MPTHFSHLNYIAVYTFLSPILVSYSNMRREISFRIRLENRNVPTGVLVSLRRFVVLGVKGTNGCKTASDDKWTMWKEAFVACDLMESGTESFLVTMHCTSTIGQNVLNTRQTS